MIGIYTGTNGELNFESDMVEMLTQVGWDKNIINHPTHKDLEKNLRRIINENNVDKLGTDSLLTDGEFAQIIDKIKSTCTSPVAANVFLNGKQVVIQSEINRHHYSVNDNIYLDIFDPVEIAGGKSRYQIVEQPVFKTSEKYNNRRGDIMLLINGFPVVHIELKASGHTLDEGTTQIQKYMNEGVYQGLFGLIQVFFVITPEDAIYFANSYPVLNPVFMFHWGNTENKAIHNWQELIKGSDQILSIPEAHQLVGYYTCASIEKDSNGCIENINTGNLLVARSYQVHAIRNILKRVKIQKWGDIDPRGGYVWGTTGCGKTLTSYKAGQLITDKNYADKVVFVVDRVELSDQSYEEYSNFARDGEPIIESKSTYNLFKLLSNNKDRLIITSMQKLSRVNEEKSRYIDPLTSLKNRNYLNDSIERWDEAEVYPQTIIIVDLNNVAYINDNYGHNEGDNVIKEAANILIKNQMEQSEIIRTNGNEFLIYLVGYEEKQVVTYIRKLSKEFKELEHGFGAAIGYSIISDGLKTVDDAINEATLDMKTNKEETHE